MDYGSHEHFACQLLKQGCKDASFAGACMVMVLMCKRAGQQHQLKQLSIRGFDSERSPQGSATNQFSSHFGVPSVSPVAGDSNVLTCGRYAVVVAVCSRK